MASSTWGSGKASVGQASRQARQLPQWSGSGSSGSSARSQSTTPSNEPRAEPGMDQAAVLADPAEPRPRGVGALHDRARVDVLRRAHGMPREGREGVGEAPQPALEHLVVVVAPRVARDAGLRARPLRLAPCVDDGRRDHAPRALEHEAGILALRRAAREESELASVASREPFGEVARARARLGGRDADEIEAEGPGKPLHPLAEARRSHARGGTAGASLRRSAAPSATISPTATA